MEDRKDIKGSSGLAGLLAFGAIGFGAARSGYLMKQTLPGNPFVPVVQPISDFEKGLRGLFKPTTGASGLSSAQIDDLLHVVDYETFAARRLQEVFQDSVTSEFIQQHAKLVAPNLRTAVESSLYLAYQRANTPIPDVLTPATIRSSLKGNITLQNSLERALGRYLNVDPMNITAQKLDIASLVGMNDSGRVRGFQAGPRLASMHVQPSIGFSQEEARAFDKAVATLRGNKYSVQFLSGKKGLATGLRVTKGKTDIFVPFVHTNKPVGLNRNLAGWGVYTDAIGNIQGYAVKVGVKDVGSELVAQRADLATIQAMAERASSGANRDMVMRTGRAMKAAFNYDPNVELSAANVMRFHGVVLPDPRLALSERNALGQVMRNKYIREGISQSGLSPDTTQTKGVYRMLRENIVNDRIGGEVYDPKSHQTFKRIWDTASISEMSSKYGLKLRATSSLRDNAISFNQLEMGVMVAEEGVLQRALKGAGLGTLMPSADELLFDPRLIGVRSLNKGYYSLMSNHPVGSPIHEILNTLKTSFGEEQLSAALQNGTVSDLISQVQASRPGFGMVTPGTFMGMNKAGEAALSGYLGGTDYIQNIMIERGQKGASDMIKVEYLNKIGIQPGFKGYGGIKAMFNFTNNDLVKIRTIQYQFQGQKKWLKESTKDLMAAAIETNRVMGDALSSRDAANLFKFQLKRFNPNMMNTFLQSLERVRGVAAFSIAGPGAGLEPGSTKTSKALSSKMSEFNFMVRSNIAAELEANPVGVGRLYLKHAERIYSNPNITNPFEIKEQVNHLINKYEQFYPDRAGQISRGAFGLQHISVSAFSTPQITGAGKFGSINLDTIRFLLAEFGADSPVIADLLEGASRNPLLNDAQAILRNIAGKGTTNVVDLNDVISYMTHSGEKSMFNPNFTERQGIFREILTKAGKSAVGEQISLGVKLPGTDRIATIMSGLDSSGGYTLRTNSQEVMSWYDRSVQGVLEHFAKGGTADTAKSVMDNYASASLNLLGGNEGIFRQSVAGRTGFLGSAVSTKGYSKASNFTEMLTELSALAESSNPINLRVANKYMGIREKFFAEKMFGTYTNLNAAQMRAVHLHSGMSVGVDNEIMNRLISESPEAAKQLAEQGYTYGIFERYPVVSRGSVNSAALYRKQELDAFAKRFNQSAATLSKDQLMIGDLIAKAAGGDFDGDQFSIFLPKNSISLTELQNRLSPNGSIEKMLQVAEGYSIKSAGSQDYGRLLALKGLSTRGKRLADAARIELGLNVEAQQQLEKRLVGQVNPLLQEATLSLYSSPGQFSQNQRDRAEELIKLINENIIKGRQKQGIEQLRVGEEFIELWRLGSFQSKDKGTRLRELAEKILSNSPDSVDQSAKNLASSMDDIVRAMALVEGGKFSSEYKNLIKNPYFVEPEQALKWLDEMSENTILKGIMPSLEQRSISARTAISNAARFNKGPLMIGLGIAAGISALFVSGRSSFDVPSQREMIRGRSDAQAINPGWSQVPTDADVLEHTRHNVVVNARAPRHYDYSGMGRMMGNTVGNSNVNISVHDFRHNRYNDEVRSRMGY